MILVSQKSQVYWLRKRWGPEELNEPFGQNYIDNRDLINFSLDKETFSENNKSPENGDDYLVNKKVLSDDIKMMHEFIEFKYFKKVMKRNNNIIE